MTAVVFCSIAGHGLVGGLAASAPTVEAPGPKAEGALTAGQRLVVPIGFSGATRVRLGVVILAVSVARFRKRLT